MPPHIHADHEVRQSHDYAFALPQQPRIVLPNPPSSDGVSHQFELSPPNIFPPEIAQAQFNQYEQLEPRSWTYDKRHEAQHVLPYLLLGPLTATKDPDWLRSTGVTLAIGVKQGNGKILDGALTRCSNLGIETRSVSIEDRSGLVQLYATTFQLLAAHLVQTSQSSGSPGKVLIFCESGNEKSAAVAAAFIIAAHDNVDHVKAMQWCRLQRFSCNFVETATTSLQCYWDILNAQRMSGAHGSTTSIVQQERQPGADRPQKRNIALIADQAADCSSMDDADRFADRVSAPFVDHTA